MSNKIIPYGRQSICQEDIDAVVETLKSDYLTQGPKVQEFEEAFAKYVGSNFAVAVANGTAALHLCALALEVNQEANVITTPITFSASANCVRYCGGNIYFADIDPKTALIDIDKVELLIKSKPKGYFSGIIPVDFGGCAVNLERIRAIAKEYNLWIIEDACHAPGAYFIDNDGAFQFCGNGKYADLAIFSFHPVKHIATGEGGMVTTNNEALYKKLLKLRTHGITKNLDEMQENHGGWYMEMQELGYNYRLTDFQAALGVSQLKKAEKGLARRREIAQEYNKAFQNSQGIQVLDSNYDTGHAFHLYVIKVQDRKGLYDFLRSKNIYTQIHYIPVHLMPYYQSLGWKKGDFTLAEEYYSQCISLPLYPDLTSSEQRYIIEQVLNYIKI